MPAPVTSASSRGARDGWRTAIATAFVVFAGLGYVASAQDVPQFAIGAWRGSAGRSDDGAVSGCMASSVFSNGDRLQLFLIADMRMGISIDGPDGRPSWVPANPTGPVRAWVDDEPEYAISGTINPDDLVLRVGSIQEKNGASVFRRIGEGRALNVTAGGVTRRYALRGTYGALAELVGCALKVRAGEVSFPPRPAPPPPIATAPSVQAPQPAPVAQRTAPPPTPSEPKVVGSGSGVAITDEGHVVTADHVVDDCRTVRIVRMGDAPVEAAIVGRDPGNDLALLRTNARFSHIGSVRVDAVRNGEPVVAYGFPLDGLLASTGNVTFGNVSALVGLRDDSRLLQISTPVQPGNSGGPLFDASGLLVGIVQSKLNAVNVARMSGDIPQNVNFAMKATIVLGFLQAHGIGAQAGRRQADLSQTAVTAQAQRVTVRVLCLR